MNNEANATNELAGLLARCAAVVIFALISLPFIVIGFVVGLAFRCIHTGFDKADDVYGWFFDWLEAPANRENG